jgi:glutathione S-transferase
VLQIYDQILAEQKYMGGAKFTLADLYHTPLVIVLIKIGEGNNLWRGLSNVERWVKEISERESVNVIRQ